MPQLTSEFIFCFGLRSLGLILTVTVLPITIVLRLGDSKNASAFVGVCLPPHNLNDFGAEDKIQIAFSLIINSYGIYILFTQKKDSRSDHCPASSRTVFDIVCFAAFVNASGVFVHFHTNRGRKPGENVFDAMDMAALVIYFGLA
jgi:hypothetical protein